MMTRLLILLTLATLTTLTGQDEVLFVDEIAYLDNNERDWTHVANPTNCEGRLWGSMALTPDNRPGETSWTITDNSTGEVLYSLGPFGQTPIWPGYTFHQAVCLAEGCYTLRVYDTGNNGMNNCTSPWNDCGYVFTYESSTGEQRISGRNFQSQDVTSFCVGESPREFCIAEELDISSDFETGADGWNCANNDPSSCSYVQNSSMPVGRQGAFHLRNDGFGALMRSPSVDLSDFDVVNLTVWGTNIGADPEDVVRIFMSCENMADQLIVEAPLGFSVTNFAFPNELLAEDFNFGNCRFNIRADAPNGTQIFIERVLVEGSICYPIPETLADDNSTVTDAGVNGATSNLRRNIAGLTLYPNPASDFLSLASDELLQSATITTATGQMVRNLNLNSGQNRIELSDLTAGIYFLTATSATGTETRRFVKR